METLSKRETNTADQELSEEERRAKALKELGLGSFEEEMKGATIDEIRNSKMQAVAILSGAVVQRRIFKNLDNLNKEELEKRGLKPREIEEVKPGVFACKLEFKSALPSYQEGDCDENKAVTGGHLRIIAANDLDKLLARELTFITTSGRKVPDGRTAAQIMAEHLEGLSSTNFGENKDKKFRIPYEQIIREENSTKTLSNLIEIIGIAWQNGWDEIGIMSNLYHFPRSKGFFRCLQEKSLLDKFLKHEAQNVYQSIAKVVEETSEILGQKLTSDDFFDFAKDLRVIFIGAEDVIKEYEKEKHIQRKKRNYTTLLAEIEQSEGYNIRRRMEEDGYDTFLKCEYQTKPT